MTNKFAGTQTEKNLWAAFAGESQARNKYDYFAGVARKEGYQQIAELLTKRLPTNASMPRSGSSTCRASATRPKI